MDNDCGRVEAKSGRAAPLRLLDAMRERLRYMHYRLRTEQAYVHWVRGFVQWSGKRHPREMGAVEVRDFLTMLASERRVAAATHRQALSALLFLYREVIGIDMPWPQELGRCVRNSSTPIGDGRKTVAKAAARLPAARARRQIQAGRLELGLVLGLPGAHPQPRSAQR